MAHLLSVGWRDGPPEADEPYPFSVPAVRGLRTLDLSAPVTFFVGENGSGKSTLLEGIASSARLQTLGSAEADVDPSLAGPRRLGSRLRLAWTRRTSVGFFLRAEDFFGYLRRMARDDARLDRERAERDGAPAAVQATDRGLHPDEVAAASYLQERDARSHGESFLDLFRVRFFGGGVYLLDEPEAPLSPQRQLALLALIGEAASEGSQFVIATHSPILLAYPGARIYSFDENPVRQVAWEELDHVTVTRDFLAAPGRYLRHLGFPSG